MDTWLAKFKKQDEQAAVALVAHEQPLQAPVEQELTTPKKKGYKLPWLPGRKWLAIVFMVLSVASMAIGLGVGLGLGMKNTTHDTSQITSDDSDLGALRINPTAMSALSLNSTMLASAALVNASSAVAADALTGDTPAPCSREAYLQARTLVAHSLPALSLLRTADNGSALIEMLLLGQSDMALVTKSDLTGAAAQLGSVTAVATAGITAAASMDPTDPADWPNTAAVLKNIRGLFGPLTSRAAGAPVNSSSTVSESNELVLLDAHQVLLATSEIMATGLPKSPTLNDLRSIVDAAAQSLLPYAREVADLWFYGPHVSASCSSTGADAAKCAARRNLYQACGLEGESALAACRAALPVNGSSSSALVAAQWACATSAQSTRNVCLQREEAARACGDQVTTAYTTCVAAPGATTTTCGARNATVRSTCLAAEQPKRVTCQATTRATETSKCADADAAARNACRNAAAAGSLDATGLTQCLAASDAAAVQCKVAMETAVRSCMEAFSCNATLATALSACDATAPGSCQTAAQAANSACLAAAPATAKSYIDAQVAAGTLVGAVRHYHTYLPYSLLTNAQRSTLGGVLTQVAGVLRV
ncbi:hypothetical protein CHLRE_13g588700v5 [Chlamydomonas reinhardtii]|uniref:Uncharacterized protein n=1 Tax=Chlamydomonas reinhardtii TaxID=3055 RepID=A8HUZ6_CHLRE|nr:uncharacterized protein CHLRE_13g588700v5 [Chlamydomonas reinhardtii]PNW74187.1 hypothetical protein CHLRE_13g588700v5 [Chlamydomonas reinhardtii]|eukprot:XP_001693888.1 predicted protein [Chlamydomonas reinhardtii]